MSTWKDRIIDVLSSAPGLTDREITDRLSGRSAPQQTVNRMCRELEAERRLTRRARHDGLLGNYLLPSAKVSAAAVANPAPAITDSGLGGPGDGFRLNPPPLGDEKNREDGWLAEDDVKRHVKSWLEGLGWRVTVAWGRTPGLDISAEKNGKRWLIEAKGGGSLPAMRVNYFLGMLGEILQRMDDPRASYSIALPDLRQFRGLRTRLPSLAKSRLGLSAIFVGAGGEITELKS